LVSMAHTRVCNALRGWAGRIPQTQVALRDAVTVASGRSPDLRVAFAVAAPSHTRCSGVRPQSIHFEVDWLAYRCGGSVGFSPASRFTRQVRGIFPKDLFFRAPKAMARPNPDGSRRDQDYSSDLYALNHNFTQHAAYRASVLFFFLPAILQFQIRRPR
jgi:hypothetical protein